MENTLPTSEDLIQDQLYITGILFEKIAIIYGLGLERVSSVISKEFLIAASPESKIGIIAAAHTATQVANKIISSHLPE